MKDWLPLSEAARASGVNRNTLALYVKLGKLKSKKGKPVRNLATTLVSLPAVMAMKPKIHAGRPRKEEP